MSTKSLFIQEIYDRLYRHLGPQKWWPAETPFEMMVGAILTQNTNWKNVEKAIFQLKQQITLNPQNLASLSLESLAQLIQPAGYFRVKAKRLLNLTHFLLQESADALDLLAAQETVVLREKLLSVSGIGPETADSILLYAFHKPIFVIDQYTYRILSRHFLVPNETDYGEMQALFMDSLPHDSVLFNEYHALIVKTGKEFCKSKPQCEHCPLKGLNWDR